jgi:hypothetical protein
MSWILVDVRYDDRLPINERIRTYAAAFFGVYNLTCGPSVEWTEKERGLWIRWRVLWWVNVEACGLGQYGRCMRKVEERRTAPVDDWFTVFP